MTDDADPRPYGRRAFLALLAGGASSFLWAPAASNVLSPLTSAASQLVGNLLPVGGWRIYTISGSMPLFDPKTWRLEISGLVRRPVSVSYQQLLALPRVHQVSTFHCVTGWTVENVRWSGVRLRAPARPRGSARPRPERFVSSRRSTRTTTRSRSSRRCSPT